MRNLDTAERLETSSQEYHLHVAHIQLDFQKEKKQLLDEIDAEETHYIDTHEDTPLGSINMAFAMHRDKSITALRKETQQIIAKELELWKERDKVIRGEMSGAD